QSLNQRTTSRRRSRIRRCDRTSRFIRNERRIKDLNHRSPKRPADCKVIFSTPGSSKFKPNVWRGCVHTSCLKIGGRSRRGVKLQLFGLRKWNRTRTVIIVWNRRRFFKDKEPACLYGS